MSMNIYSSDAKARLFVSPSFEQYRPLQKILCCYRS